MSFFFLSRSSFVADRLLLFSRHFSAAVSTDGNRATFVNNIKSTMTEFAVDGVDLDWEYPGQTSGGTESFSPDDTVNFLAFLQLLRSTLSAGTRITAATQTATFVDEHGEPLKDVSEFAKVLDAITVMAYDTWGCEQPFPSHKFLTILTCLAIFSVFRSRSQRTTQQRMSQFYPAYGERRWRIPTVDCSRLPCFADRPRCPLIRLHLEILRNDASSQISHAFSPLCSKRRRQQPRPE